MFPGHVGERFFKDGKREIINGKQVRLIMYTGGVSMCGDTGPSDRSVVKDIFSVFFFNGNGGKVFVKQ